MTAQDNEEVRNHSALAREFLTKGREYLDAGGLRQASEKGWGAAAHMAKAVAVAQSWQYTRHGHFHRVMNQTGRLTNNAHLPFLHGRAEILHINYYELKEDLDAGQIGQDLDSVAEMLHILAPMTGLDQERA